jgi:hypothetical protein
MRRWKPSCITTEASSNSGRKCPNNKARESMLSGLYFSIAETGIENGISRTPQSHRNSYKTRTRLS